MAFTDEHKAKFENLKISLEQQNREQLKRKANGGNSILFVYPPNEENLYLNKLKKINVNDIFHIINISSLFVEFIERSSYSKIERKYKIFKATPHKVFLPFKDFIIEKISNTQKSKIPVLIRTGALYGTGIENIHIMENNVVMNLKQPLVIFYPAVLHDNNLYFLNFKPASKYRCTVIE